MKISQNIYLKLFKYKPLKKKLPKYLKSLLNDKSQLMISLTRFYKNSYNKKLIFKYKKYSKINLIGMGGSSLGARSIYFFLKEKIKKEFRFFDNLSFKNEIINPKKKILNLIISKSGNTLETIANVNFIIKKNQRNIFITENKNNYLMTLAKKLKSDVVFHNNFIGGRFSVLSEVGMLPAELMGLNQSKFKQFNTLVKNKRFINALISNVSAMLNCANKNKTNSIILNYDENSTDLFYWYQQLIAESLGKKNKGLLPIISTLPKDNHSLMQSYLDGPKNNFFTFFFVKENPSIKINNKNLLKSHFFLKNKSMYDIKKAQFEATQKVFDKKNIPFRSFVIDKRKEETLGELFTFFILETILLGKALNINPLDQPAVELIKKETKKNFNFQ